MKITVNIDPANVILARHKLQRGGEAQRLLVHELRRVMDPYVPMLTGVLKNGAVETTFSVKYVAPYARRQYYENKGNGLRGKEWDKRAWADRGREVTNTIAKFVGGTAKW